MVDFGSSKQDMADLESSIQETVEDDFYLLEGAEDDFCLLEGEEDDFCLVEGDFSSVENAEDDFEGAGDSDWDADESFYPFPTLSCNSTAEVPKDEADPPKHMNMKKEVRLEDVVREHVLHFLPAKSLCRFRSVSRGWDRWITSPFFAHRQTTCFQNLSGFFCQVPGLNPTFISFNHDAYGMPDPSLNFLPEPVNIRTSCNGLLCCQSVEDNVYYICNPVTKLWKRLPKPNLYHGAGAAAVLAFEPKPLNFNESYELVCAVTFSDHPVVYFEIYSSRSSSWRLCYTVCYELDSFEFLTCGYYMKGVIYWESTSGVILAFDLKNEQYGILPLPSTGGQSGAFTVIHGELCYILARHQDDGCTIYIHGDMHMTLKSVINLPCDNVGTIFGICRALPSINDDILILALGRKVIAYHIRDQKVELISTWAGDACTMYLPYVNSLASVRHPLVGNRA